MVTIKLKQRSRIQRISFTNFFRLGICILFSLFLASCVTLQDPEVSQEYQADAIGLVTKEQSLGQSFHSRRSRLNSIQLWLRLKSDSSTLSQSSKFEFSLYHNVNDAEPILTKSIPLEAIKQSFPLTISFTPQEDPPGQSYYLSLKTNDGAIEIFGRNEDIYPKGQAYLNRNTLDADFAFRSSYDYDLKSVHEDLLTFIAQIWIVIPLILSLWLPGRFIFFIFQHSDGMENVNSFDWGERVAISIGLSLAFFPVLLFWTTLLGIRWNSLLSIFFISVLVIIFLWLLRKGIFSIIFELRSIKFRPQPLDIGLGVVFILSLGVRLAMVRDMATPAWVDSVHHAVVTRLIVEQGQYPTSYLPYIDVTTTSYHSGFHANLALFYWISGVMTPEAMLLYGQILNALCVFAVYLFTKSLLKNRLAGIIAASISAFFTPMPAYYTSWGRYPQLAGILILPVVYALVLYLSQKIKNFNNIKSFFHIIKGYIFQLVITAIALSGLMLTHYRVTAFFFCLIFSQWILELFYSTQKSRLHRIFSPTLLVIISIALLSVLLTLPWWPNTFATLFSPHISQNQILVKPFADFSWQFLNGALGKYFNAIALIGIAWGLLHRQRYTFVISIWVLMLFVLANLGVLRLPGTGLINNNSVEIMLFMPQSALCGILLAEIFSGWDTLISSSFKIFYRITASLFFVSLVFLGIKNILPILNPITMLSRNADKPALKWLDDNIPKDATVIINPFLWGYGIYAGNDGGFWITPVAGRRTTPPPIIFAMGESTSQKGAVSELSKQLLDTSNSQSELYNFMETQNINYIFIGARGGVLSPKLLNKSPGFQELYGQDGVWIFKRLENSFTQESP